METFTIYVDLSEKGVDLELVVSPQGKSYLVRLDGVIFTILEYEITWFPAYRQEGWFLVPGSF